MAQAMVTPSIGHGLWNTLYEIYPLRTPYIFWKYYLALLKLREIPQRPNPATSKVVLFYHFQISSLHLDKTTGERWTVIDAAHLPPIFLNRYNIKYGLEFKSVLACKKTHKGSSKIQTRECVIDNIHKYIWQIRKSCFIFRIWKQRPWKKELLKHEQGGQGSPYASMGCAKMHDSKIGRKLRTGTKKRPVHSSLA